MTENDRLIRMVAEGQKMKVEIPLTMYLLMFLQIAMTAYIGLMLKTGVVTQLI